MKRHSESCPCFENIKVQTEYFSDFIEKVSNGDKKRQSALLSKADPCFIRYLSHCAKGVLNGDIHLSKKKFKEIVPDKKVLIKLVRKTTPLEQKRQFLIKEQKGGFLGILAGIASAALSSILSRQISKLLG